MPSKTSYFNPALFRKNLARFWPLWGGASALGALALYVSDGSVARFQPMNINFGIITPLGQRVRGKRAKNLALSQRSLEIIDGLREAVLSDTQPAGEGGERRAQI